MIKIRLSLFWKELVMFGTTLLGGVFSAYQQAPLREKSILGPELNLGDIIIILFFLVLFFSAIFKFRRLGSVSFKFILILVVFSGTNIVAGSVMSSPWDVLSALAVAAAFVTIHNIMVHDIGIVLGIAGVGSALGITIAPGMALTMLIVLSFYDILAVYWTKHMVYMAKRMIESGAIFGFIIPFDAKDFFFHKGEARQKIGEKFMVLGSGDIGLPLIMASSVAADSLSGAVIVSLFALGGLFLTHVIFVNQEERRPMAALPPIATMTIVGYLVSQLL